jgi:3,4-dihydroxy 2-butanone 4-phosphate synthase/GTP cyclohydrolase II
VGPDNLGYLRTKRDRMGHDIPGLPDVEALPVVPDVEVRT